VRLFGIIAASFAAGYVVAIMAARSSAPKETRYDIPHGFTVGDPTFLSSALPAPAMTAGNTIDLPENGNQIFPAMLAAIASARRTKAAPTR